MVIYHIVCGNPLSWDATNRPITASDAEKEPESYLLFREPKRNIRTGTQFLLPPDMFNFQLWDTGGDILNLLNFGGA